QIGRHLATNKSKPQKKESHETVELHRSRHRYRTAVTRGKCAIIFQRHGVRHRRRLRSRSQGGEFALARAIRRIVGIAPWLSRNRRPWFGPVCPLHARGGL